MLRDRLRATWFVLTKAQFAGVMRCEEKVAGNVVHMPTLTYLEFVNEPGYRVFHLIPGNSTCFRVNDTRCFVKRKGELLWSEEPQHVIAECPHRYYSEISSTFRRLWYKGFKRPALVLLCVENGGYLASLRKGQRYTQLPDEDAEKHQLVRVIDDSGGDYLYPKEYFTEPKGGSQPSME